MSRLFLFTLVLLICSALTVSAQKKSVTLEDVFKKGTFSQKSVHGINWMKDGQYYSSLVNSGSPKVVKINVATGEQEAVLIDGGALGIEFSDYSFNNDETKALLVSEVESIYRRSSKGNYHVLDLRSGNVQELMN